MNYQVLSSYHESALAGLVECRYSFVIAVVNCQFNMRGAVPQAEAASLAANIA
jgi:hypothetical protein